VLGLETLRLSLRADTYQAWAPDSRAERAGRAGRPVRSARSS